MICFSVIITTYNRHDLLPRSVSSVLKQSWADFELIVVDDASDPEPRIESFLPASDKIRYIRHDTNQGASAARNTGIGLARYPCIVFLDDDDMFHEDYLSRMAHHLTQYPDIDFAWCSKKNIVVQNGVIVAEKESIYDVSSYSCEDPCPMLTYWANSIGVMIKKRVFDQIGLFDTTLSTAEDLDLLLRMLAGGMQFVSIPEVLIDVYIYEESLSRQTASQKEADNLSCMIEKNQKFLDKHSRIWAYYMKSLIVSLYRAGQKKSARSNLITLLKRRPRMWVLLFRAIRYEFLRASG